MLFGVRYMELKHGLKGNIASDTCYYLIRLLNKIKVQVHPFVNFSH